MTTHTTPAARRVIRRVLADAVRRRPDQHVSGLDLLTLGLAPGELLLAALARERGGVARRLLEGAGADPVALAGELDAAGVAWPSLEALAPHGATLSRLMTGEEFFQTILAGEPPPARTITTADLLHALLEAHTPAVREALARSGAAISTADPLAALRRLDLDLDALRFACETADAADEGPGEPLDPTASPAALLAGLAGPTPEARTRALEQVMCWIATRRRGAGRFVPAVTALLADPSSANRMMAAQVLGQIGPPARSAADALRDRLRDQPAVRVAAADALHALGLAGTVPDADRDAALEPAGGLEAAWTLWKYTADHERVVPRLRALMADPSADTRGGAALYLREIGPPAEAALSELERLAADDPSTFVRHMARDAVAVVSGVAPAPAGYDPDDGEPDEAGDDADTDEAERERADWTDALALDPLDVPALRGRAAARLRAGDRPGAIADYAAAVALAPADVETLRALGWARVEEREYATAEADLSAALRLVPADTDLRYKRAVCRRRAGNPVAALADYDEVIRREPGKPNVHQGRALARQEVGDYAGQRADAEVSIRLDPDDGVFLNDLAWHLATCLDPAFRDPERAVGLAERAVELCSGANPGVLDTLACAYAAAGRFDRAVVTAERAVALGEPADRPMFAGHLELFAAGRAYTVPAPTARPPAASA